MYLTKWFVIVQFPNNSRARFVSGIAVADMLVMVEYIPFTIHMNLWTSGREPEEQYSWNWAALLWFHVNFSIVIHAVSIFLTLTLAVWRFIMIRFHTLAPIYCTMERCKIVILCAYGKLASILSHPCRFAYRLGSISSQTHNSCLHSFLRNISIAIKIVLWAYRRPNRTVHFRSDRPSQATVD